MTTYQNLYVATTTPWSKRETWAEWYQQFRAMPKKDQRDLEAWYLKEEQS